MNPKDVGLLCLVINQEANPASCNEAKERRSLVFSVCNQENLLLKTVTKNLDNPTGIDRVLTEKYLLADSYLDLKASILDEKEFLLLKVISTLLELSCLICSMVGAGLGTDSVALSMTHFSGRIFSSQFMVLGRETLAFVISVINKVVSPLWGLRRTLDAQVFMTLYWIL
ncbi:hypothetical protein GmHk_02G004557 [Glycine max]|nr:hypothetical protein GmHk_02G004557 [Glycine max]